MSIGNALAQMQFSDKKAAKFVEAVSSTQLYGCMCVWIDCSTLGPAGDTQESCC